MLCKAEERRGADTAARKERCFAAGGNVKAVAETRERIERLPRRAAGEPVRSAADDFIKERDALFVPVADGDGPAQEETGQAKVEELTRRGDGRGVALEPQAVDARGNEGVLRDGVSYFDQSISSFQTISPPIIVSLHAPVRHVPAKGVARPMVRNASGSTV